ncbi:MAG: phosphoribosyltransferase family protein, partial [Dethiobacteria bacterium]
MGRYVSEIIDADGIRRALTRIAYEIVERNKGTGDVVLVGIKRRGVPLAHRLAGFIEKNEGLRPPVGLLDITPYRDDRTEKDINPAEYRGGVLDQEVAEKVVVLVDDVLFTGRSV